MEIPVYEAKSSNTKKWFYNVIFLALSFSFFIRVQFDGNVKYFIWLTSPSRKKDKTSLGLQLLTYMYRCLTMLLSSVSQSPDKAGHWMFVSHNWGLFYRYQYQNKSQTQRFEQLNVSWYTSNDLEKLWQFFHNKLLLWILPKETEQTTTPSCSYTCNKGICSTWKKVWERVCGKTVSPDSSFIVITNCICSDFFYKKSIDMYFTTHTVTIKFHFTLKHQLQGMDNVLQQTSICLIL